MLLTTNELIRTAENSESAIEASITLTGGISATHRLSFSHFDDPYLYLCHEGIDGEQEEISATDFYALYPFDTPVWRTEC